MKKPVLSIILAAHREGRIAHKTVRSLERAVEKLENNEIPYEIIVTIDNGDTETESYFEFSKIKNTTVHSISFGDLAHSRNYGIAQSSGAYIATIDADDLVSENWLYDGLEILRAAKSPVVLHTHYSINFGTQDIIWEKFDSRSKEEDAIIMTWANRWDSAVMASRSVFEDFPYQPNTEGYGSEDWHFNSETLAANIPHKVVPQTILFVRRKDISLMTIQAASRRTVRYTNLLDFSELRKIDLTRFDSITPTAKPLISKEVVRSAKSYASAMHRKIKNHSTLYAKSTSKIISTLKQLSSDEKSQRFPDWLIEEWRNIHSIEKGLFPSKELVDMVELYHSEMYELGIILSKLARSTTENPTYLIFVPYLTNGGAELLALRYVDAIQKTRPDWHIAVVATESGENIWKDRLAEGVDFVDFGSLTKHLSEDLKLQILARFIVQSRASHLHIAQSPLMFRFAQLYETLLTPLTVYAFAFCEDEDMQGRISGHVHSGLPYAYNAIDKIITDNKTIVAQLKGEYGYIDDKFHAHYQPVEYSPIPAKESLDEKSVRVLWASRIAKQKRPDILAAIAGSLPSTVHIDVYGSFQDGYTEEGLFSEVGNLTYRGAFNGLSSVDTQDYDIFLYTSENDGIPNILLEATSLGLPIVSSNSGGIAEFVTPSTGRLIQDREDIQSYIKAINEIAADNALRTGLVDAAQKKLKTQHSYEKFLSSIQKDIN